LNCCNYERVFDPEDDNKHVIGIVNEDEAEVNGSFVFPLVVARRVVAVVIVVVVVGFVVVSSAAPVPGVDWAIGLGHVASA